MPHARRLRVLSPRHPQLQKQNLFERSLGRAQPPPVVMSALAFQRFFFSPSGCVFAAAKSVFLGGGGSSWNELAYAVVVPVAKVAK